MLNYLINSGLGGMAHTSRPVFPIEYVPRNNCLFLALLIYALGKTLCIGGGISLAATKCDIREEDALDLEKTIPALRRLLLCSRLPLICV